MPRGGRRRREGTRWFADIHATPQAYHAGPDAVIHRSAWKKNSRKFKVANFRSLPRPGTYRDGGEPTFSPQPHPDATCIARIRYKLLRLATISTSENFSSTHSGE